MCRLCRAIKVNLCFVETVNNVYQNRKAQKLVLLADTDGRRYETAYQIRYEAKKGNIQYITNYKQNDFLRGGAMLKIKQVYTVTEMKLKPLAHKQSSILRIGIIGEKDASMNHQCLTYLARYKR